MEYAIVGFGTLGAAVAWTALHAWLDRTSATYRQVMSRFDRTVIYPAIAKWFLVRTAGIIAKQEKMAEMAEKEVRLV